MFKLAHLSDPHLGPLPKPTAIELTSQRILGYINYRRNRAGTLNDTILKSLTDDIAAQAVDHTAITGDFVNIALNKEIKATRLWLESLGTGHDISITLGNHDAYIRGTRERAMKSWKDYITSEEPTGKTPFPYLRRRGNIAIIGLSSAVASLPVMAIGRVGAKQLKAATPLIRQAQAEGRFCIILIHHPPHMIGLKRHKRLVDKAKVLTWLQEEGANLILHGHSHKRSLKWLEGPAHNIPCLGVPSVSSAGDGHHQPARYNLISIEREEKQWSCQIEERGKAKDGTIQTLDKSDLSTPL